MSAFEPAAQQGLWGPEVGVHIDQCCPVANPLLHCSMSPTCASPASSRVAVSNAIGIPQELLLWQVTIYCYPPAHSPPGAGPAPPQPSLSPSPPLFVPLSLHPVMPLFQPPAPQRPCPYPHPCPDHAWCGSIPCRIGLSAWLSVCSVGLSICTHAVQRVANAVCIMLFGQSLAAAVQQWYHDYSVKLRLIESAPRNGKDSTSLQCTVLCTPKVQVGKGDISEGEAAKLFLSSLECKIIHTNFQLGQSGHFLGDKIFFKLENMESNRQRLGGNQRRLEGNHLDIWVASDWKKKIVKLSKTGDVGTFGLHQTKIPGGTAMASMCRFC